MNRSKQNAQRLSALAKGPGNVIVNISARAATLCLFPPLQILVYRLPDVVLHRHLCVVREPLKRGDLPRKQIGWVSLCDLLAWAFLGSHDEILLWSA
jgi:hypothetical protein